MLNIRVDLTLSNVFVSGLDGITCIKLFRKVNLKQSKTIRGYQRLSETIRDYQTLSETIKDYQRQYQEFKENAFRINYDVACNMDFHRYPVDEQSCEVKFESFGFSNKQAEF